MNVQYASLHEPVSNDDIAIFKAAYPARKTSILSKIFFAFIITSFAFMALSAAIAGEYPVIIIVLVTASPLFWMYYKFIHGRTKRLARVYKFALQNQARLLVDVPPRGYAGVIFSAGHSHVIKEALVFPNGSEIGLHKFTTGSGKNQRDNYWGYMRVKLLRNVPNMLLDSKKNNFIGGRFSNLPLSYKKDQTIQLEGTFNDYFTLYAPVDYGRDAFYIFTPDVMAALIDHGYDFDIEVIDNHLMFYSSRPFNLESEAEISKLLLVVDTISSELIDQTDYYTDERTASRESDAVAAPGRRLKTKVPVLVIVFIIIYIAYFLFNPLLVFVTQMIGR